MAIIDSHLNVQTHVSEVAVGDFLLDPSFHLHGVFQVEDVQANLDTDGEWTILLDVGVATILVDEFAWFVVVG